MKFKIAVLNHAKFDLKYAVDYYNKKQKGLGKKFYQDFKSCLKALEINPYYQIRYDTIRCFPSKKFPFMIHFRVDETAKLVSVEAVISSHMNPEEEWLYEKD